MLEKILLIDGNSIINRAFYALPPLANKNGEFTNGVYGFLNILFRFLDEENPKYLAVAFDLPAPTFRHLEFEGYKANRTKMPDELRQQFPVLKELLRKMNIGIIELEGFEADDILGTLAKKSEIQGLDVCLVSGDKDLLQIASEKTKIRIPKTKSGKTEVENYNEKEVIEKFGVTPKEYIDVKALMGDKSDNIPGVPSIGEKTALKIIQQYKSIEEALKNIAEIKPKKAAENLVTFWEQAVLSKYLATICIDVPVEFCEDKMSRANIYNEEAFEEIKKLEFKSLLNRFLINKVVKEEKPSPKKNFKLVTDFEKIDKYINEVLKQKLVAYNLMMVDSNIYGISFAHEKDEGTFIYFDEFNENVILNKCKKFFESDINKISLNSKFEKVYLYKFGIEIKNIIFDCMLGGYVINASNSTYDYDDIAKDFLNENYPTETEILGKGKKKILFSSLEKSEMLNFACLKSNVIFRSYDIMNKIIKKNDQQYLYYEIELPLVDVLKNMEIFGIKVNEKELINYQNMLEEKLDLLTKEIYNISGEQFNINSPQQLGVVLFENLELKGSKKTKTGYSTSHEVLEKLVDKHEIIPKILEYRTISKLKSTYADGLLKVLNPQEKKIYSTFNQVITTTGRISSTEPNLQNIPIKMELGRQLRKVFIPSSDEYVFLDGDYSQIELRVLADISCDTTLINAFKNDEDIHKLTASQVFNIPFDEVTQTQRSNAKAVNFGIVYGIGSFSLGQDLSISRKEADNYIEGYFEKYPDVKKYLDNSIEFTKTNGFAKTIFNRRRNIPEIYSLNFIEKNFGQRVAMNMPIQGTAADIIKIAMIKVHNRIIKDNLDARLILQVHDELLLEVNRNEVENIKKIIIEEMENAVALKVPIKADVHVGENWHDAK